MLELYHAYWNYEGIMEITEQTLAYVAEKDLAAYAEDRAFPIIPCTLCGSQENLQRKVIGEMLREWEKRHPGRIESITRALTEVRPSHLLDRNLFDFAGLQALAADKLNSKDEETHSA